MESASASANSARIFPHPLFPFPLPHEFSYDMTCTLPRGLMVSCNVGIDFICSSYLSAHWWIAKNSKNDLSCRAASLMLKLLSIGAVLVRRRYTIGSNSGTGAAANYSLTTN